ncbi:MAG: guanylate kinase [Patescibacteria group bacterium]|jgi:guanylate kinase
MSKKVYLVISGPSGSGKTTVAEALLKADASLTRLVTNTSRSPRPGEVDGRDYHFLSREEFIARRDQGEFFEWAETYGNFYGSSRRELEKLWRDHRVVLGILDIVGVRAVRAAIPECVTVYVTPGSLDELRGRLEARPGSTPEDVARRFGKAQEEMASAGREFDHRVVNADGKLDEAVAELRRIIDASA